MMHQRDRATILWTMTVSCQSPEQDETAMVATLSQRVPVFVVLSAASFAATTKPFAVAPCG
jgi:hypothetical protein